MKYKLALVAKCMLLCMAASATSGCATSKVTTTIKVGGSRSSDGTIKVDGSVEVIVVGSELIKRTTAMFAQVISWTDYQTMDLSTFAIRVTDSGTSTGLNSQSRIVIDVMSGGTVIGSGSFPVRKVGDEIKLAEPNAVKRWGEQFIGYADGIDYHLDLQSRNTSSVGTVTIAQTENGVTKAASSATYTKPRNPNDPPIHEN